MAKIEIEVRSVGTEVSWKEEYVCDGDPQVWAEKLIARFNSTLRVGEKPRELLGVRVLDTSANKGDS